MDTLFDLVAALDRRLPEEQAELARLEVHRIRQVGKEKWHAASAGTLPVAGWAKCSHTHVLPCSTRKVACARWRIRRHWMRARQSRCGGHRVLLSGMVCQTECSGWPQWKCFALGLLVPPLHFQDPHKIVTTALLSCAPECTAQSTRIYCLQCPA